MQVAAISPAAMQAIVHHMAPDKRGRGIMQVTLESVQCCKQGSTKRT